VLGGNNTYTGTTSINNGIIQITTNNALPTTTSLNLGQAASANVGTFDMNGHNQSVSDLTTTAGTGSAVNTVTSTTGACTLTVTGSGADVYGTSTVGNQGIISGPVSLVMNGSGSLTLGNTNTYTGTTTVTAGSLFVNGATASSSAVSVASAATFGGSGTAAGTVSLSGTVAPGSAPATVGALNTGAFTFNANSTYKFEVSNAGAAAGTGYDEIISSGAITCSASPINIDITSLAGITFSSSTSYTWTIASGAIRQAFVVVFFRAGNVEFASATA
jgi:autotransporter-associated beta strand protein